MQYQTYPRRSSGRKTTSRAASVPVGQQEISRLEFLRSKKQTPSRLDVENSSLPSARGRKRDLSFSATSQADCTASASTLVAEQVADAGEQRPRKRHKRSLSTPAAPRSSQLSVQLQSRKHARSRFGSPATDMEYVLPSRVSVRLRRKTQPFINDRSADIYTHLADPDSAGNLLSEPPCSVILSTSNEIAGSQSVKKSRGRRRKITDLTDENVKKSLMEEWALMRQSQGTLPLMGINENTPFNQTLLHENQKDDGPVSSMQLEVITQGNPLDADPMKSQPTIIGDSQSQEGVLDVALQGSSSTQMDFENALPVGTDTSYKNLDLRDSTLPPDGETRQPIAPILHTEPSAPTSDSQMNEDSSTGKFTGVLGTTHHLDLLQHPGSCSPSPSFLPSREDSAHVGHTKLTKLPINKQIEVVSFDNLLKDGHSVTLSQTYPFDSGSIHLDSDEEFYMLDIPEVFTLPWVPLSPHLYVPPSLGKLISGMKEQLMIEARARRRAEELYQAELSRRISAEEIIEDLRTVLEEKQKDSPRKSTR